MGKEILYAKLEINIAITPPFYKNKFSPSTSCHLIFGEIIQISL